MTLVMTLMMMIKCDTSVMMLLLTALFFSIKPVQGQRRFTASSPTLYKVHLSNYVVEAGTGVNLKPPISPAPRNLRWSSYAIDMALEAENMNASSTDEYYRKFNEKCQQRVRRPCTEIFSINAPRKSLTMSAVALELADIFRVFQGTERGFSSQYVQRRYIRFNESALNQQDFADSGKDEAELDRLEIREAVNINYAIYLSVYDNHVCSFASKPRYVNHGDTLRLRCQIVMSGYWVPSLYFRNEYDGSIYEGNTTLCGSPARPNRYCSLVDVEVGATTLAFACHVKFPTEGRFVPTIPAYAEAQWPHHNHHSPVCYLDKVYVDTIPSDVTFLCDKMPCEDTIDVGQEITCQAEAYPSPVVQLSVIIAAPHRDRKPGQEEEQEEGITEEPNLQELNEKLEEEDWIEGEDGEYEPEEEDDLEEEEKEKQEGGNVFLDADDPGDTGEDHSEEHTTEIVEGEEQVDPTTGTVSGTESEMSTLSLSDPEQETEGPINDGTSEETEETEGTMAERTMAEGTMAEGRTVTEEREDIATSSDETVLQTLQDSEASPEPETETPEAQTPEGEEPEGEESEGEESEELTTAESIPGGNMTVVEKPTEKMPGEVDGRQNKSANNTEEEKEEGSGEEEEEEEEEGEYEGEEEEEEEEEEEYEEEEEEDSWRSEGIEQKVITEDVYKVTEGVAGKVLEVTCNISNSLGWGSNSMVLEVRSGATSSSTAPRVVGTARTTPRTDEDNLSESPPTESPVAEPDDIATVAQKTKEAEKAEKKEEEEEEEEEEDETEDPGESAEKMTIEDSLLSTEEQHIDPGEDDKWKQTVAPEEEMSRTVRVTIDDSKLVDKEEVPEPDDEGEDDEEDDEEEESGEEESGEEELKAAAAPLPMGTTHISLPTAHPGDVEAQMELARKYGPKDIKLYCNGALCLGVPRMFVGDSLKCDASGTPKPHISFSIEGRIINSDKYELTDDDRGSMTIVCIAKNQYGSMTSKIVLSVSRKAQIVQKFRKDDEPSAGRRPGPRTKAFFFWLNIFLSLTVNIIVDLHELQQH